MERERKKRKKFDTGGEDGEKEDALPDLVPPASLTVCGTIMENITGFKV